MASRPGGALLRRAAAAAAQVRPLYRRLSALGNAPEGSVAKTMNQWLREGRCVRSIDVVGFATKLRKYGRFKHALELMEWMDARGMNLHYNDYALRLQLISKVEGIESAEKYFSRFSMPAKNLITYETLLSCYCTVKMEDKAIALHKKMQQLNFASSFAYNNLMTLHMKLGQPEKVPPLLQQMMAENIAPNMITYSLVLNSYASSKDVEAVEQLVKLMKEHDADMLKWSFYGALASFYISTGLFKKAESALKMLEKTMDIYEQLCYHYLISLYSKTGNLLEVNRVWNHLKASFPKITNKSYFRMLSALDRQNDLDALKHCFEEWRSNCSAYDPKLPCLVVKAYLRRDMIGEAESVLKDAILRSSETIIYAYPIFIDYCLEKQRTDSALKYVEDVVLKVKNQLWKPSKDKVDMFLRYIQDKNMDGAEVFLDSLKKIDFLDSDAHGNLLSKPAAAEGKPLLHQLFKD